MADYYTLLGPILGRFILWAALLFPNIFYSSYVTRLLTFTAIALPTASIFKGHKIANPVISYFGGIFAAWLILWSMVMTLIYNPPREFCRVRKTKVIGTTTSNSEGAQISAYQWEPCPKQFGRKRLLWTLDLLFNFRGVGWSHQPHRIPPHISNNLAIARNSLEESHLKTDAQTQSKTSFLICQLMLLLRDYLWWDVFTHFSVMDPYFQGEHSQISLAPAYLVGYYPVAVACWRIFLVFSTTYALMEMFFVTSISFIAVCIFGDEWLGTWGERWMHPSLFGHLVGVYHKGLRGFWGSFWHNLYRVGFESISQFMVPPPSHGAPLSLSYEFLRMEIVFILSGILHAAASYAVDSNTYPAQPFLCFVLQGIGIILQTILTKLVRRVSRQRYIVKIVVFCFSLVWLYLTLRLLLDDLSRRGVYKGLALPFNIIDILRR